METHGIKEPFTDKVLYAINYLLLTLIFVIVAYPLIYILSSSFSSGAAVTGGKVWLWPVDPSFNGYIAVFKYNTVIPAFLNSVLYTVAGTAFAVALTVMAAYPLSRKELKGRGFFMFLFMFTMLFGGGLIPNYLLVKNLGMLNTRWAIIIPFVFSTFNMIITRTYYNTSIPEELHEAAELDGCGDFRYMLTILLPLSKAITAVVTLYYAVGFWNSWFNAMIYLSNPKLLPLPMILREILVINNVSLVALNFEEMARRAALKDLLQYALIVVASIPIICVYPFVQKYFMKGVMIGSLKG